MMFIFKCVVSCLTYLLILQFTEVSHTPALSKRLSFNEKQNDDQVETSPHHEKCMYGKESLFNVEISQTPCAVCYTPNSPLLQSLSSNDIRFAANRPRYSTCGGVSWLSDNRLVSVNMQGCFIQIYEFSNEGLTALTPLFRYDNTHGMDLARPENIGISRSGQIITIPNMSSGKVQFYFTDSCEGIIPFPVMTIAGNRAHGTRFSQDDRFLAYASTGDCGVSIYSIFPKPALVMKTGVLSPPMKPKSMDFSLDGRFIVIGSCINLTDKEGTSSGIISVYPFDSKTGKIGANRVSETKVIDSVETLVFHPDGTHFFTTDQINDRIYGHRFNTSSGEIEATWIALAGKSSELFLPHGLDFSPDGRYLAISNYGDDKVTIHEVYKGLNPSNPNPIPVSP